MMPIHKPNWMTDGSSIKAPLWARVLAPIYRNKYNWRKLGFLAKRSAVGALPVISVGSISLGGSGKTPLLNLILSDQNLQLAQTAVIVKDTGSKGVNPSNDEALLIEKACPNAEIIRASNKIAAVAQLNTRCLQPEWIFIDDGFQLFSLEKLEVVVLRPSEISTPSATLPIGYAREDLSALLRAHFLVIRAQNIDYELNSKVSAMYPSLKIAWAYDDIYSVIDIKSWFNFQLTSAYAKIDSSMHSKNQNSYRVLLWAGTARPELIARQLESKFKFTVEVLATNDHDNNYNSLLAALRRDQAVLITEKDAHRFSSRLMSLHPENANRLSVICHRLKWHNESPVKQMLKEAKIIYETANL